VLITNNNNKNVHTVYTKITLAYMRQTKLYYAVLYSEFFFFLQKCSKQMIKRSKFLLQKKLKNIYQYNHEKIYYYISDND
jgi:hypothetical protein